MMKINFLFGAGISLPAGIPKTKEISRKIFMGGRIYLHTDSNFYLREEGLAHDEDQYVEVIKRYLLYLHEYGEKYYRELLVRDLTYEDLYFLAIQVHQSLIGDFDNPVLFPLETELVPKMEELVKPLATSARDWDYKELSRMAVDYIHDVVYLALLQETSDLNYLEFLKDAINDSEVEGIDIFTLNHDKLVENYLASQQIIFADGFGDEIERMRWWLANWIEDNEVKTRLLKLHGSVDWYLMNIDPQRTPLGRVGIPLDWDHWHATSPNGQFIRSIEHRPLILIGTFNKIYRYSDDIFAELFCYFLATLRNTDVLIVSGYSFGDKGVNNALLRWILDKPENQIVLIEPDFEGLKKRARHAIASRLAEWEASSKLKLIPKGIERTDWSEIKHLLV